MDKTGLRVRKGNCLESREGDRSHTRRSTTQPPCDFLPVYTTPRKDTSWYSIVPSALIRVAWSIFLECGRSPLLSLSEPSWTMEPFSYITSDPSRGLRCDEPLQLQAPLGQKEQEVKEKEIKSDITDITHSLQHENQQSRMGYGSEVSMRNLFDFVQPLSRMCRSLVDVGRPIRNWCNRRPRGPSFNFNCTRWVFCDAVLA